MIERGRPGGSPAMMAVGAGVAAAGLSLLALFWAASLRTSVQQLAGAVRDRDARLAALERRPEPQPVDGLKRSISAVEADVKRLRDDIALLREGVERKGTPSGIEELTALVGRLGEEVTRAVALAEKASQEAQAATELAGKAAQNAGASAANPAGSAASAEEVMRLAASVSALEKRLAELEQKKPASSGQPPKIDEQALRTLIKQVAAEEFQRLMDEWRARMRGRQPGGRGGGGGGND